MNFEQLQGVLGKETVNWSVDDVQAWLSFIQLEGLKDYFHSLAIDGPTLLELDPTDLTQELKVSSNIVIKKLMKWIKEYLPQYNTYLRSGLQEKEAVRQFSKESHSKNMRAQVQAMISDLSSEEETVHSADHSEPDGLHHFVSHGDCVLKQKELDGTCLNQALYIFNRHSTHITIGRQNDNVVKLMEEDISRKHCKVIKRNGVYMLVDLNSLQGTFIRIKNWPIEMQKGMVFEMGQQVFIVTQLIFSDTLHEIELERYSYNQQDKKVFVISCDPAHTTKRRYTIGRKVSCDFAQEDDSHLSNIHAVISIGRGFFLEDLASTNGTWQKIKPDHPFPLVHRHEFRVGTSNNIFEMNLVSGQPTTNLKGDSKEEEEEEVHGNHKCFICIENDKDCVYFPCRHQVSCIECAKKVVDCPICKQGILDFVRVFTS